MGLTLNKLSSEKALWVFDTFEGLPAPSVLDPDYETAKLHTGTCRGELDEVTALFQQCGLMHRAKLVKGLFQNTLSESEVESISVLHIDGDWYESVMSCLVHLYDRVSPGGMIQIDDYGHWEGARKAVDEFFQRRGSNIRLRYLDYTGRQFMKPLNDH